MVPTTPIASARGHDSANFTRPQEAETPSNLNQRTAKRHQSQSRSLNNLPPPLLNYGDSAPVNDHSVRKALEGRVAASDQFTRDRNSVFRLFADNVDNFVAQFHKKPTQRPHAVEIAHYTTAYLQNVLSALSEGSAFAPMRPRSLPSSSSDEPTQAPATKVSFAGMAKALKNSGADMLPVKKSRSSGSGKLSATASSSGGASVSSSGSQLKKEDTRLLVAISSEALMKRTDQTAFAIRQELCARIPELTLKRLAKITKTNTGWALCPQDIATRDFLSTQENLEIIRQVTSAISVNRHETWHTYAVAGVPVTMHNLFGNAITQTAELIVEEVEAQTGHTPVSCRSSRHGADENTGKITWLISFKSRVKPFRLFNTSQESKLKEKKTPIVRHDPGCQGFCNPAKCTRYSRCVTCGDRNDNNPGGIHEGPSGVNCQHPPKCVNCHGPYPADHEQCPAMPKRVNGQLIKLNKKQRDAVRRHGDRNFREVARVRAATTAPTVSQASSMDSSSEERSQVGSQASTQSSQGNPTAMFSDADVVSLNRKRFADYESGVSRPTPIASKPSTSRPKKSTGKGRDLNLAHSSQGSAPPDSSANDVDMESIDELACEL